MSDASASALERLLRRDRVIVALGLAGVVAGSWLYLLQGAGMEGAETSGVTAMASGGHWSPGYAGLILAMWVVMMVAMMLPGAAPMVLFYTGIARRRRPRADAAALTGSFVLGYIVVWGAFSVGAVMLQYLMAASALISPMMRTTSIGLAGALLIGAGIWQWTPLKDTCLRHCRSPLHFVLSHWRDGTGGAFMMGARHGGYCLGCCWVLMLLLFVGGVMNLLWIAGLALYVLLEKVMPAGRWFRRLAGLFLVVWGGGVISSIV